MKFHSNWGLGATGREWHIPLLGGVGKYHSAQLTGGESNHLFQRGPPQFTAS